MRQGVGQANPDPPSPGSPSPQRRRRVRRWVVVLLTLALLTEGGYGWWRPSEAWPVALSAVFGPIFTTILTLGRADERGDIPERIGNRMMAGATGYGVACGVAVAVGAWLAR